MKINGNDYTVAINEVEEEIAHVEVNGMPFTVEFEKPIAKKPAAAAAKPAAQKAQPQPGMPPKASSPAPAAGQGSAVTSPLPGVIISIAVNEGDAVKKGQKLMVLEAMKMENVIEATSDGTVKSINVKQGDSVLEGATLATIG